MSVQPTPVHEGNSLQNVWRGVITSGSPFISSRGRHPESGGLYKDLQISKGYRGCLGDWLKWPQLASVNGDDSHPTHLSCWVYGSF